MNDCISGPRLPVVKSNHVNKYNINIYDNDIYFLFDLTKVKMSNTFYRLKSFIPSLIIIKITTY